MQCKCLGYRAVWGVVKVKRITACGFLQGILFSILIHIAAAKLYRNIFMKLHRLCLRLYTELPYLLSIHTQKDSLLSVKQRCH